MKKTKRLGALAMALALTLSALAGCGKNDAGSASSSDPGGSSGDTSQQAEPMDLSQVTDPWMAVSGMAGTTAVARLGGSEVTASELLYWLYQNARSYLDQFGGYITEIPWDADMGDGTTLGGLMKDGALDTALFYHSLDLLGLEERLPPSTEVTKAIEENYADLVLQLNGNEEAARHVLWEDMLSLDLWTYLNECSDQYVQLQERYFGEDSGNYPTDAEVSAWLEEEGTYRAKHILLATMDLTTRTPLDEETIAQKKTLAEDLLAQIQGAADPIALFDTLMHEYSEDTGLDANPDGYVAYKGQMVAPFEQTALSLGSGEISGIVESDYGYHIILRLPLDPAEYRPQMLAQRMEEKITQWQEAQGVERTDTYEQLDPAVFWDNLTALQAAVNAEIQAIQDSASDGSQTNP